MEKEVAFFGPGKAFGELALIKNAPRAASIRSFNHNVELAVMTKGSYNEVLGAIQ
jgi:CRP-like cAMP-binding protein